MDIAVSRFGSPHHLLPQLPVGELLAAPQGFEGADFRTVGDRLGLAEHLVYPVDPPHPDMPEQPYVQLHVAPTAAERAAGALTTAAAQAHIAWRIAAVSGIDADARSWIAVTDDANDRITILAAVRGLEEAPLDLWETARRAETEALRIAAQLTAEQHALAAPTGHDLIPRHEVHLVLVEDGPLAVHGGDVRAHRLLHDLGLRPALLTSSEAHRTPFGAAAAYCRALAAHTRDILDGAGYCVELHHRPPALPRTPARPPTAAVTWRPAARTTPPSSPPAMPAVAATARSR